MPFSLRLVALAAALALPGGSTVAEDERRVSTPGDIEQVTRVLAEIRDGCRRNQAQLPSYRLRGTLTPGDFEFVLTQRNGRARYDVEFEHQARGRSRRHVLTDGRTLLQVELETLRVYPAKTRNVSWLELCDELKLFQSLPSLDSDGVQAPDDYCEELIKFLEGRGRFRRHHDVVRSGALIVTAATKGSLRTVTLAQGDLTDVEIAFDADQGCQVVRWEKAQRNEDREQWTHRATVETRYQQLASGAWVPVSGRFGVKETGRIAERDNRPPEWFREFRVESVEAFDFPVAEDELSLESLPLGQPLAIEDYRYAPARNNTAKLGLADEFLQNLIADLEFGESP